MTLQKAIMTPDMAAGESRGTAGASVDPGFSLVEFLRVLRIHWRIIVGTALTIFAITLAVLWLLPPLYSATAVVMLDQRRNNIEDVSAVLSGLPTDPASVQNQVEILTSRKLVGRVVDKLHLREDPEFNPDLQSGFFPATFNPAKWFSGSKTNADIQRNEVIDKVLKQLTVDPVGVSTAIDVTFDAEERGKAPRIANAIADAYVEDQLNAKFEATQKATQWLADRIQELSQKSQAADAAVQQYKAENNLSETAKGGSLVEQQMADISKQLVDANSDLAQKQAAYGRVAALARAGHAADISQVVASPLIAQLRSQETELIRQEAELSSKYGPNHPKMLDLESQKANVQSKIAEEVHRIVETVASDVAIAQAHVNSLQGDLRQLERRSVVENKSKVRLAALESNAASTRSMYQAMTGKLNETQGQTGIQSPDARVISPAEPPVRASFPRPALTMVIAAPAGLVLGLLFAFMSEWLNAGFRTRAEVEAALALPVLATVPEVKIGGDTVSQARAIAERIIDRPMSTFAESIRGLQLALTLSNTDKKPKIVVITSSMPGEGKTVLTVSLGRRAAVSGLKTLIIDSDFRKPMLLDIIGGKAEFGIVDVLAGSRKFDQCIVKDVRSDAQILPCLRAPPNALDLLSSRAMHLLIESVHKMYDLVLIDSPPILPVNDAKTVSKLADAVLFVVLWNKTPRDAVINAVKGLANVQAPIAGVALSRADQRQFQYYSYGIQNYDSFSRYYRD